jgi:plastocyanin
MVAPEVSMTRLAFVALVLAACGGDDGATTQMDAPVTTNKVQAVTCPGTADGNVMTIGTVDAYMPMTQTVPVNAVVKFTMNAAHNVAPNTAAGATTDPGLTVDFGQTKCLKFTTAGTFSFFCSAHGFTGTITVQ